MRGLKKMMILLQTFNDKRQNSSLQFNSLQLLGLQREANI